MSKELAKQYDPKEVEDRIYKMWLDGGYFHAKREEGKDTYTIVIPPPNITGQLHMGHALDNTLQDILIRFKRMQGYDTLWLPGTDHAAIATEAKIVEAMRKEGITKEEIGREGFLKRAWDWKATYGSRIIEQHSCASNTDILEPQPGAMSVMAYADGYSAAVAFGDNRYRTITLGFPLECIQQSQLRTSIMKGIMNYLINN